MPKIRVVIADDHALIRAGLRALLSAPPDMEVVGEAGDGVVVVEQCRRARPEIVLMDLTMPGRGGISAIQDLRRSYPDVRAVVVTMHEDPAYLRQALLVGAAGYVLKKSLAQELISAIRAVHQGRVFVSPELAPAVPNGAPVPPPERSANGLLERLTEREREVARFTALGHTNAETAAQLHISERTVETHRLHIMTKLGLHTRADLVRFALEMQLIGERSKPPHGNSHS